MSIKHSQQSAFSSAGSPALKVTRRAFQAPGAARPKWLQLFGLVLLLAMSVTLTSHAADKVSLMRTPEGGIQPQAAVDSRGVVHLIYFKGDPKGGDLYYVHFKPGDGRVSSPVRVNSQPESAVAMGTIRGAQMVVGQNDRVHVVWNGSGTAQPKGLGGTPMLYTHLNAEGTAFEPQRNLITWAGGLDGGGSVAADNKGTVYVTWHAMANAKDEAGRAVFVARSSDNGETFTREKQASVKPTGACGCCGMKAFTDRNGTLSILYRAAGDKINRDMTLLVSRDQAGSFQQESVHPWTLNACPMSSASMANGKSGVLAAWETKEQVYFANLEPDSLSLSAPLGAPAGPGPRKHPFIIANSQGETLFAWTEGTGWNRGGAVAWQVYDASGKPTEAKGRTSGVPVWGLLSGFTRPDGSFVILY